jgi:hypothetical protein
MGWRVDFIAFAKICAWRTARRIERSFRLSRATLIVKTSNHPNDESPRSYCQNTVDDGSVSIAALLTAY